MYGFTYMWDLKQNTKLIEKKFTVTETKRGNWRSDQDFQLYENKKQHNVITY